jgi:rhodanese-related sulfurtransferase/DNA-binding transcriptional ArsR family regulator
MTTPPSPARTFKNAAYAHLAEVGRAVASGPRVELLELLAQAPRTVEVLAREIDQSVANTSFHLKALKRAQLVVGQRAGSHVTYTLAGPEVGALVALLHTVAAKHVAALERLAKDFFAARDELEPLDARTLMARVAADEVVLVDVRPELEYAAGHIPGALSIPIEQLESHLEQLPRDRTIVAYCRGPFCAFSADAARRLRALGFDARRADLAVHAVGLEVPSP